MRGYRACGQGLDQTSSNSYYGEDACRHRPSRDSRTHGGRRRAGGRAADLGAPSAAAATRRAERAVQVSVRGARPSRFVIRLGGRVARFPLLRAGRRHRAWVTFPEAGRWRYGVRIGSRDRFVGRPSSVWRFPRLQQPYGIVAQTGGALLVADYRSWTPSSDSFRHAAAQRSSPGFRGLATYGRPRTGRCSSPRAGTSTSSTRAPELFASARGRRAGSRGSAAGARRRSLRRRGAAADRPHRGRRVASRPCRRAERRPRDPVDSRRCGGLRVVRGKTSGS